jgi:hypothetical protein
MGCGCGNSFALEDQYTMQEITTGCSEVAVASDGTTNLLPLIAIGIGAVALFSYFAFDKN